MAQPSDKAFEIKICGLSTPDSLEAVIAGGATHMGLIFFEKSPRHVTFENASRLAEKADGRIAKVAVCVNADDQQLSQIVAAVRPDILQLHGKETPERVAEVKDRFGIPVMKAFAIENANDLEKTRTYEGLADRFLFDAKAPKGSELPGGNGVSFDWNLLKTFQTSTPWMLSGGLDIDNIDDAIARSGAPGIDISSGVELSPGVKDVEAIDRFLLRVTHLTSTHA